MYKVLTLNNISARGLERFPREHYEIASEFSQPDVILVRSANMHDMQHRDNLIAIGRAGVGVNNIPVDTLSKRGVAVFNAPGANANAVKELVIAGMLVASRNLTQARDYVIDLESAGDALQKEVEAGKKQYVGFELPGRTLGVVGLGAVGVQVANTAKALGMNVLGYDPTITVQRAWQLSAEVESAESMDDLMSRVDFVTVHVPLIDATRKLINRERLGLMREGVVVLNFARAEIVDEDAILAGIDSGKVHSYVCDFPTERLKRHPKVICFPHLGASTREAEENCAMMIANQIRDYLENGNISNSVNFPEVRLVRKGQARLAIANANVPDMVAKISHDLGRHNINIVHMINESRGEMAYTMLDTETAVEPAVVDAIASIEGVLKVRLID
ncbi:MAG: phosphoglycerate dehydrogenase [Gammaproteobacteria bacterium]